ncbi:MAG: beta-galactosidase [bacterium]|nr:beta-galactosidase [bacterium]
MIRRSLVWLPLLVALIPPRPAAAQGHTDSFQKLDTAYWRPVNLFGARALPGLAVKAEEGVLRIKGTTAFETINLGGVRTLNTWRASAERPFVLEVTRAYASGRAGGGEAGIMLLRPDMSFAYLQEPMRPSVRNYSHAETWQLVLRGRNPPPFGDIMEVLAAHPQPLFDCDLYRIPRRIRLTHDGTKLTVAMDGKERVSVPIPWNDGFVVVLGAGARNPSVAVDAGFADLRIEGEAGPPLPAMPQDAAGWEPAAAEYWRGDKALQPGAAEKVMTTKPGVQLAQVLRSGWSQQTIKDFIDWSVAQGLNCVALDIPWGAVERRRGQFDFERFDGIINYAVNRGLWVQIKPWWIQRTYPDWISPALEQKAIGGNRVLTELTFANDELNSLIANYVGKVAEHYRGYPVTCYTPVAGSAAELEYPFSNWQDDSEWARAQFRAWLKTQYGTLDRLDAAWGGRYPTWGAVTPPADLAPPKEGPDLRRPVLDWFRYREWAIGRLVDAMGAAIHRVDPRALFAIQTGQIHDGPSDARRASIGILNWGRAADMLIVDPQPRDGSIMGYSMDLIRADGKVAGMELDAPARFVLPLEQYTANSVQCWTHGGIWSSWANWRPDELKDAAIVAMTKNTVAAAGPRRSIARPATALFLSKWDLYCYHDQPRWRDCQSAYAALTGNGAQVIDVLIDETVLADPEALGHYEKIAVPFADCLDRRVKDVLDRHRDRLAIDRPESYARHLLDFGREP